MFGILNINKPVGATSRDVVTRIVRLIRDETGIKIKAGHAGTLDPIASGVLIVCIGKATRLIQYIQRSSKSYLAKFRIDVTSKSADIESDLQPIPMPVRPAPDEWQKLIPRFTGLIQQVPPAYSAISINGKRAYKLARQGIDFEIQPKEVRIDRLEIVSYEYPILELGVECGTGTYIRSLGRDMARAIGSDAVMTELIRDRISQFGIETALPLDNLEFSDIQSGLLDPIQGVIDLPRVQINSAQHELLANGRFVDVHEVALFDSGNQISIVDDQPGEWAAVDSHGRLVAILEPVKTATKPAQENEGDAREDSRVRQLKSKFNLG